MAAYFITGALYLATFVLIRWVLLTRTRAPAASVAWILAIIFLPIFGGLLFLVFGVNRVERRRRIRARADEAAHDLIGTPYESTKEVVSSSTLSELGARMANVVERTCDFSPTSGNAVEIMPDTNRIFGLIEQAVLAATDSIHLEYYIWEPDQTGHRLRDLLIERASDGIEVRVLYDSIGSMSLRERFFAPMRAAGIEVAPFSPGETLRERWSINLRSHRKIVVVDGRIGFTGGMNIGDEYLGKSERIGAWRDTHVRLEGPAVLQLQQVFAEDWYYATGNEISEPRYYPQPETTSDKRVQIVSGGPMAYPAPFHAVFFAAIAEAKREVLLTTSYFIPTEPLAMALESAALRGVRVRLLVPGRTAHFVSFTVWAGRAYYEPLLESGCEIFEYDQGLLHTKTLVIDGEWSLVGTPNFDARSTYLNFEVGAAFFDPKEAIALQEHFEHDLRSATPVTLTTRQQASVRQRLLENALRLFAPMM